MMDYEKLYDGFHKLCMKALDDMTAHDIMHVMTDVRNDFNNNFMAVIIEGLVDEKIKEHIKELQVLSRKKSNPLVGA